MFVISGSLQKAMLAKNGMQWTYWSFFFRKKKRKRKRLSTNTAPLNQGFKRQNMTNSL